MIKLLSEIIIVTSSTVF